MDFRIGEGYDAHRLVFGRDLILGGVQIKFEKGLLGHSDADVLIHAVMDSLLGAAGQGDIGKHFPDTDEQYRGISSLLLLKKVAETLKNKNFSINNIDATIVAQKPKLATFIPQMQENIAKILDMELERVNIKATTTEKMGFEGREEGISARSICLLNKK
jgi:2-C-methyl-D-erythritol 2,4-cyclodiphosphate synthase